MANLINASALNLKVVIVGISLVGLVLGAASLSSKINSVEEKSAMDVTTNTAPGAAIPPIDASAPAQTETATFALG